MRGERQLLRLGEYLVGRACRRLPRDIREERYQEWAAELPAILRDHQIRLAPQRAARMLAYAADNVRGASRTSTRARRRTPLMTTALNLILVPGLISLAGAIWVTVQAPGRGSNYLQLAWAVLLVAWAISERAHSTKRTSVLIFIGGTLTGASLNLWNAAQAPGDWVHYFLAAWLFLALPAWWLTDRRARIRRAPD